MQGNLLALGPVPAQEARAVPGDSDYAARAFAQCQRFIALLRRRLGSEPDGARLGVRRSEQDFDAYLEVVLRFDDGNGAARAYADRCDRDAPARWDHEHDLEQVGPQRLNEMGSRTAGWHAIQEGRRT